MDVGVGGVTLFWAGSSRRAGMLAWLSTTACAACASRQGNEVDGERMLAVLAAAEGDRTGPHAVPAPALRTPLWPRAWRGLARPGEPCGPLTRRPRRGCPGLRMAPPNGRRGLPSYCNVARAAPLAARSLPCNKCLFLTEPSNPWQVGLSYFDLQVDRPVLRGGITPATPRRAAPTISWQ